MHTPSCFILFFLSRRWMKWTGKRTLVFFFFCNYKKCFQRFWKMNPESTGAETQICSGPLYYFFCFQIELSIKRVSAVLSFALDVCFWTFFGVWFLLFQARHIRLTVQRCLPVWSLHFACSPRTQPPHRRQSESEVDLFPGLLFISAYLCWTFCTHADTGSSLSIFHAELRQN